MAWRCVWQARRLVLARPAHCPQYTQFQAVPVFGGSVVGRRWLGKVGDELVFSDEEDDATRFTSELAEAVARGQLADVDRIVRSPGFQFHTHAWRQQFSPKALDQQLAKACQGKCSRADAHGAHTLLSLLRAASAPPPTPKGLMSRVRRETSVAFAPPPREDDLVARLRSRVLGTDAGVAPSRAASAVVMRLLLAHGCQGEASVVGRWARPEARPAPRVDLKRLAACVGDDARDSLRLTEALLESGDPSTLRASSLDALRQHSRAFEFTRVQQQQQQQAQQEQQQAQQDPPHANKGNTQGQGK